MTDSRMVTDPGAADSRTARDRIADALVTDSRIVDPGASTPPYEQLRRRIAARIDSGELEVGARLPTVRLLAQETGLAVNTVARSYKELEATGYLRAEGRRGTFVAATADRRAGSDPVGLCSAAELTLWRPATHRDPALLATLVDPALALVGHDGRLVEGPAGTALMAAEAADGPRIEALRADLLGPSTVLVSCVRQGGSGARWSSVWVAGVTGWRCRWRQVTELAPPR